VLLRRDADERLDPVRRLRPPRPSSLLRSVLVASLLGLAAAALYAEPEPAPVREAAAPTPSGSPAGRLAVPPGLVGVPVHLADPAALAVVRTGDRVDLTAAAGGASSAVLAASVLVLDVAATGETAVLYLAVTEAQARSLTGARPDVRFGVMVRPR
jgi:hypothetical protein